MRVNQNDLARTVTIKEGKKINCTIGQTKEVLGIAFDTLVKEYGTNDIVRIEIVKKKDGRTISAV